MSNDQPKKDRRGGKGRRKWDIEMEQRVDLLSTSIDTHLVECEQRGAQILDHLARQDVDLAEIRGLKRFVKFAVGISGTVLVVLQIIDALSKH
jgi:hypothetical protein